MSMMWMLAMSHVCGSGTVTPPNLQPNLACGDWCGVPPWRHRRALAGAELRGWGLGVL